MPPKGARTPMVWKENRENAYCEITPAILALKEQWEKKNYIDPKLYKEYNVKRGLRDEDGRGVLTGLTRVGEIQSYSVTEGEHIIPQDGMLYYRGIDCRELVKGSEGRRFAFEETAYLLLFGELPTAAQLEAFCQQLASYRTLPTNFFRDVIMKAPPRDLMNTMQRGILTLFCYDDKPNDIGLENVLRQCLQLMSNMPVLAIYAYQAWRYSQGESLFIHVPKPELSTAENFLRMIRPDKSYTEEEAHLLDMMLMLHAEHGGGNNSTFVCRALSSSGTDTYSAIAGAVGSLKGPLHGGANAKVMEMFHYIQENVDPHDDGSIRDYLVRLLDGEAGDRSGKLYGLGHAVYTLSDPRAVLLKKYARHMAQIKGYEEEFDLLQKVEELGIPLVQERRHSDTPMCANVDMYSGLVYTMLDIPEDVFTPLFASARIAGWCANRMEEVITGQRIMRPAYRAVTIRGHYVPMEERTSRIKEFDL